MAHLNEKRNVNEAWVIDHHFNNAMREMTFRVYVGYFTLHVTHDGCDLSLMDANYLREMVPSQAQLIMLAEYLWRPSYRISITLKQALHTIHYLEATRDVQLAQSL